MVVELIVVSLFVCFLYIDTTLERMRHEIRHITQRLKTCLCARALGTGI